MASQRAVAFVGSGLVIVGAVLVGEVLHVTVVRGESAITDPGVLVRAAIGIAFVLVGSRLDVHPREYLSLPSDPAGEREGSGAEDGFDEGLSPLDADAFDSIEARERERERERVRERGPEGGSDRR